MQVKTEYLYQAWNRHVALYKRSEDSSDHRLPMRIRGYTEMTMKELKPREHKEVVTAVERGYRLADGNRAAIATKFVVSVVPWQVGYIGKTKASLWFPTRDMRDRCMKLMEAQLVMTDKFKPSNLVDVGDHRIRVNMPVAFGKAKANFTELRNVIDEHMAEWAAEREAYAKQLADPEFVLRVPFDSYLRRFEKNE